MIDLTSFKQIITELTGVDANLFKVSEMFWKTKGRIYMSYKIEDDKVSKKYNFCLELKKEKLEFASYSYLEETLVTKKYIEHNEIESFIIDKYLFGEAKINKTKGGEFIKSLNKKVNR